MIPLTIIISLKENNLNFDMELSDVNQVLPQMFEIEIDVKSDKECTSYVIPILLSKIIMECGGLRCGELLDYAPIKYCLEELQTKNICLSNTNLRFMVELVIQTYFHENIRKENNIIKTE